MKITVTKYATLIAQTSKTRGHVCIISTQKCSSWIPINTTVNVGFTGWIYRAGNRLKISLWTISCTFFIKTGTMTFYRHIPEQQSNTNIVLIILLLSLLTILKFCTSFLKLMELKVTVQSFDLTNSGLFTNLQTAGNTVQVVVLISNHLCHSQARLSTTDFWGKISP